MCCRKSCPSLQQRFPDLRVELRETQTRTLMDELARGALDAVLLALPVDEGEIETLALFDDPFLLAVPAGDARGDSRRVDARDIDQERLILLEEGHCLRDQALAFCAPRRDAPAGLGATSLSTVMQMVANGYGVTLLPKIALDVEQRDERVKLLRFRDPEPARTDRARVAAHLAAQGRFRGARADRARDAARMSSVVAVIGAGPAGLMAAEVLAQGGAQVTVYDRMPSAGRKFLMAGRGGLNLTHSEELERVPRALWRRGGCAAAPRSRRFRRTRCAPGAKRWDSRPSSDRADGCFRVAMKASPLLRAWLRRLDAAGVQFALRHAGPGGTTHGG